MLEGMNDSIADARRLVKLLAALRAKVNLIFYNPLAGSPLSGQLARTRWRPFKRS